MTLIIDSTLKHEDEIKFAAANTAPGMFHLAVNNPFRVCGDCRHFMTTDQVRRMGIKTSRCNLLHKHNGPKARKNQRRIPADQLGWKSGEQDKGADDLPEWMQERLI